ncbi:hypothetical protein [uncultured Leifsonia sp.]|uniref:hypothetical protein n=1 Tax=uncultured Leifsonia sp. TaxID=340359 RepID=UPI0025E7E0E1|nr:hypothetical protein [uncultured Leifsonia sp.]
MTLFAIWPSFGFRENPYSQDTLPAAEEGDMLIVGRDSEIQALQRAIGSGGAHPSVEGPVGVGKTSLINVATYRMAKQCMEARERVLFIPAVRTFQPTDTAAAFEHELFRGIAQTLLKYRGSFSHVGLPEPETDGWEEWLTRPVFENVSGGGGVATVSVQMGYGSEPNTSDGYTASGFQEEIRRQLALVFGENGGGIVCVLDNLEVLESVGNARTTLDQLRDRVFNIPGIRWVLCGSRGIVSRARTERLSGVIRSAMQVRALDDESAVEAIHRRISYFGETTAEAPVTPEGFEFLYQALHRNLRNALEFAQEFSDWLAQEYLDSGKDLPGPDERDALLQAWLVEKAEQARSDASGVQPRVWQFFVDLCAKNGRAGSSEFEEYGFVNQQQLTSSVTALVDCNLVVRETDPENGTRTINSVTALGWLVFFYKEQVELPGATS